MIPVNLGPKVYCVIEARLYTLGFFKQETVSNLSQKVAHIHYFRYKLPMASQADEYTLRVPKQTSKKYNVMRFNAGDRVDIRVSTLLNYCFN